MTNQPKIGQEVLIHGYIDEIRKDTIIIQNDGGYFGTVEHEITDIEIPNTNEVLDKIRGEIKKERDLINKGINISADDFKAGMSYAITIIDKYKKGDGE